ncbi:MAG TPA: cobyric acid synthase, partial [Acidimicrobiales bacterium]|nr:cobyric acid synthase [Acidimicrobiales bacterium]
MRGGLMVCGTASDVGKSHLVTGICRFLARRGLRVAPFKAQNMALNSFVTEDGHEIARAQAVQATAAGVEPRVDMNPILLKPTGEATSQVVVMGRPLAHMSAGEYQRAKPELFGLVQDALARLRAAFDVVVCEGAGSPAEINLAGSDLVNLRLAEAAGLPAILVGDIDRGGAFASLVGTLALLPPGQRRLVRGMVVNKLRGDPGLLGGATEELRRITGVPTLGVVPWL